MKPSDWDPTFCPCVRPLEAFALPEDQDGRIGLRDPSGLSDVVLLLSSAALALSAMMDGTRSCQEICEGFSAAVGGQLPIGMFQELLTHFSNARFLEGPEFDEFYEQTLNEYRDKALREMPHAAALGINDSSGALFNEMLEESTPAPITGRIVGLIAPHLDYPRGRPCYAAAYATLRDRPVPDRIVILGTNHFGRSTSVVTTGSSFETPLGTTRTDTSFIERLEQRCGDLRAFELDHLREHSVELQLAWLQHLFGAESFELAAFLCPDPCGPAGTAPATENGVDLRDFAQTLGTMMAEDARDTLLVAGADMSHVGANFGDDRRLNDEYLQEVRDHDETALSRLTKEGAEGWLRYMVQDGNPTHVCSVGCVFALATVLGDASVTRLGYHQAVDLATQTCVTCAAVAYT